MVHGALKNTTTRNGIIPKMKKLTWFVGSVVLGLALGLVGCGQKQAVETSALESSFKSAEPAAQTTVGKAVEAIKKADYPAALAELQKLAADAKLTPEQQTAVKDIIEQLKKLAAETLKQASEGANKAAGDLQKTLTK
jgi:hypothetical protein